MNSEGGAGAGKVDGRLYPVCKLSEYLDGSSVESSAEFDILGSAALGVFFIGLHTNASLVPLGRV